MRLELTTSSVTGWRSNQLNYRAKIDYLTSIAKKLCFVNSFFEKNINCIKTFGKIIEINSNLLIFFVNCAII